jgi:hypothetical protein
MLKKVNELALAPNRDWLRPPILGWAPIFWETIVFLLLIPLVLASLSERTFSPGRAMALGCQGFAVTLLVALVFIFDRPFKRRTLSPQPIAEMQNRASTGR